MKLRAKIMKGRMTVLEKESTLEGQEKFHQQLEHSLVALCGEMGISVPLWIGKNTREFARFKKTSFNPDQFIEPFAFDRFEIRLEE